MFLDLDHFKETNDSHGHPIGDKLLRIVSSELSDAIRETDTVARLGGDEFALIITHLEDEKHLHMLAQRIIDKVSQPHIIDDCFVKAGTSIGVCFCPLDGTDPDELIRKADHALYQAKADGSNCYNVYDKALHAKITSMANLEAELNQALKTEEFVLHYQPQYDISGERVVGAEALMRWNDPKRGFLYPGDFIPVAESSGLIIPMGEWALETACLQNKAWQDQGLAPFRVSVNVAACQFQTKNFVASVEHALDHSGLESRWLEVEITESVMLADSPEGMEEIIKKLWCLRKLGVTRARAANWKPSNEGITTSATSRSNCTALAAASASKPSPTAKTSCPARSDALARNTRIVVSSSAKSIRAMSHFRATIFAHLSVGGSDHQPWSHFLAKG
jgi:diguanylate cyclase (GGDEF)-like protein